VKGTASDAAVGWQLGCDGYLTKPFEIDDLLGEVAAVTSRSAAERAPVRDARLAAALELVAERGEAVPGGPSDGSGRP
jgi:DNA-binding response OmpR family regulator